ncbi:MAG TPA: prolyl oligopeptidase family serine peptidase, partial [Gemmatales bacterium]|nr:prolyl oligopeptidase family serine peptidase [Gemmatales bacterium]
ESAGAASASPRGSGGPPGAAPAAASAPASPGHSGTDLVLRNLAQGTEMVLGNVADYSFDKKGQWLVTTIDAAGQGGNGVYLHELKTGILLPIETGKATYRQINWNEERTAFSVTRATDDPGYEDKWVSILGFSDLGPSPTKTSYDPKGDKDFPQNMAISASRGATWTEALDGFVFGIAERKKKADSRPAPGARPEGKPSEGKSSEVKPGESKPGETKPTESKPEPKKEEASSTVKPASPAGPRPDLVIWHWKDERLQPMQQVQANADKSFTYTCLYQGKNKKFLRLADEKVKNVTVAPKHRYAIGRDASPYEYMANLDGQRFADIYVIDLADGKRTQALKKNRYFQGTSPTGTHFLYYEDGHYFAYDMASQQSKNLTASLRGTSFVNEENDLNIAKPPRPFLGWARDGSQVILSDGWDLWAVKTDGSGGTLLTGNGRQEQIRYQGITQYEPETKPGYDFSQPLYVTLYGEWTKKSGFGRIDPGANRVQVLLWDDCQFGTPFKARQAEVFAYTRQTAQVFPDYHLTDASFAKSTQVTEANPQQKDYLWSAGVKLIDYTGTGGKKLQGSLFLPAGDEEGKRYPTVIYIYERLSQGTHQYTPPSYRGGFNKSIYTSNGYAVLMPDITYRINDPGKSSVECILPALDAAIATTVVDGEKVGLHGHSWGGYQTAFGITQTNRFKCAIAGAPLTDLISMYSSIYWNTGSANQPIFESSQGRFTAGYWDEQDAYIRNSPVFFARNVQTPLLLLHNDKDGAVDFTQGIEYYNTLRRLQKPVVMLQYKGENHGLAKTENQKDYAVRMREFFDHYLQGKPAPDWWKEGVPHLKMEEHLKQRP